MEQTNKYEQFKNEYRVFLDVADAVKTLNDEGLNKFVIKTTAGLIIDPQLQDYKTYLLRNPNAQPEEYANVLNLGAQQKDALITSLEGDLEGIINDMNDQDVLVGLQIVPAKESYSGPNAETYQKITDLYKETEKMQGILQAKDVDTMYEAVKASEAIRLNSVDAGQRALCEALINTKGNFVFDGYSRKAQEVQREFMGTLNGNEKGYLTANLGGVRFRDFCNTLETVKVEEQERQRQAQSQGRQGQGNQGQKRPRQGR
tara:strand:- start:3021 stop:3797 length:777 start_codon:yes stop_codon:yes gene_type:complete